MNKQIIDTKVLQAVVNFLQTLPHKDVHLLLTEIMGSAEEHPDNVIEPPAETPTTPELNSVPPTELEKATAEVTDITPVKRTRRKHSS